MFEESPAYGWLIRIGIPLLKGGRQEVYNSERITESTSFLSTLTKWPLPPVAGIPFIHITYGDLLFGPSTFVDLFESGSCLTTFHPVTWSQSQRWLYFARIAVALLLRPTELPVRRNGPNKCSLYSKYLHLTRVSSSSSTHCGVLLRANALPLFHCSLSALHPLNAI